MVDSPARCCGRAAASVAGGIQPLEEVGGVGFGRSGAGETDACGLLSGSAGEYIRSKFYSLIRFRSLDRSRLEE